MTPRERLPRMGAEFYRGEAMVHWTMAMKSRAAGWLDARLHAGLREALLHVGARFFLCCPVYCLMPDHAHFLFAGLREESDQRGAMRMFRKSFGELLPQGVVLQRQAHDHVLREKERERGAFETIADYVLRNPERAGLVADWREYAFCGSIVAGYPSLNPRRERFWESFWLAFAEGASRRI
jgi:putative transposase